MPDHVLQPCKVGIPSRGSAILPADIIQKFILPPTGKIEGRICHNEIRLELRVAVIEESVRIKLAEVGFNSSYGQIHLRHFPSGRVGVLTKNGNPIDVSAVVLYKLCGLTLKSEL